MDTEGGSGIDKVGVIANISIIKLIYRAYNIHPNEWARIANIVDRTETDCRDRYRNELQNRDTRIKGMQQVSRRIAAHTRIVGFSRGTKACQGDQRVERAGGKRTTWT